MTTSRTLTDRLRATETKLTRAEAFDLLSNARRRGVIQFLRQAEDEVVSVDAVIDAVVSWEHDDEPVAITEQQRASVYSSLVQTHLPRLEAAGVIEFDADAGEVRPTEIAREVELYLEYSPRADIPWAEFYLGLAAVGAALLSVVWAEVGPFTHLSETHVAVGLVAILVLSAGLHLFETRRSRVASESFERELRGE